MSHTVRKLATRLPLLPDVVLAVGLVAATCAVRAACVALL